MKALKLFAAVAVALATLACNKEQATPDEALEPQTEQISAPEGYVRLTFTTPVETKTSVDKESGVVSWSEGDKIKICWEGGSSVSDEVVISGGVARFTANVSEAAEDLYAVYPSGTSASVAEGAFKVDIPQSQSGRFADADIIVAKTTKTDLTYAFHHAVSLVRFVISDGNAKGITRAQFVDLANKSCLYGTASISFNGTDIEAIANPDVTDNDVIDITAVAEGDNWIAVPAAKSLLGYGLRLGTASAWLTGIVGENPYTFDAAGKRLALGTMDAKINDGDWYIKADGTGDGTSWEKAGGAEKLQSLIGDYNSGDAKNLARLWRVNGKTIKVAEGYYVSPGGVNGFTARYVGDDSIAIVIEGGYTASGTKSASAKTVFGPESDVDPNRAFFFYGDKLSITLQDLYISGHERTGSAGGSALYSTGDASLTVIGCTVEDNSTQNDRGGGAFLVNGPVRFENCTFSNNGSNQVGGAVMIDSGATSVVFEGCTFTGNSCTKESKGNGGALYLKAPTTITGCTFTGNSVINSTAKNNTYGNGGAIYSISDVEISESIFNGNVAPDGGAIFLEQTGSLRVDRCKFIGNHTDGKRWYSSSTFNGREGSGVFAFQDATYAEGNLASAYFNACEFRDNYAVSTVIQCSNIAYAFAEATDLGFNNCVFYGNDDESKANASKAGWGVYSRGALVMTNSTMIENCSNAVFYPTGAGSYVYNNIIVSTGEGAGIRGAQSKGIPSHDYNIISSYRSDNANTLSNPGNEVEASALGSGAEVSYDTFAAGKAAGVSTGMSYYSWNGTDPVFTKTGKAAIAEQIGATNFYAWLNSLNALDVDIRGNQRNASAFWPGSYEN